MKRLCVFELERVDLQSFRPLRRRRRRVELDQHAVVATQLAQAELREEPSRLFVGRKREGVELRQPELARPLLCTRDEPGTEPSALVLGMDEPVELERLAVREADAVRSDLAVVVQQPRVVLEIHHPPPAEQLGLGRLRPALHRDVRGGDELVDRRRVVDGHAPDARAPQAGTSSSSVSGSADRSAQLARRSRFRTLAVAVDPHRRQTERASRDDVVVVALRDVHVMVRRGTGLFEEPVPVCPAPACTSRSPRRRSRARTERRSAPATPR